MEQSYVTGLPHLLFGSLHWPVSKGAISVGSVVSVAMRPARKDEVGVQSQSSRLVIRTDLLYDTKHEIPAQTPISDQLAFGPGTLPDQEKPLCTCEPTNLAWSNELRESKPSMRPGCLLISLQAASQCGSS